MHSQLACYHDISISVSDHAECISNAVSTSGACCAGRVIGALQAVLNADCSSSHIGKHPGDKERVDAPYFALNA